MRDKFLFRSLFILAFCFTASFFVVSGDGEKVLVVGNNAREVAVVVKTFEALACVVQSHILPASVENGYQGTLRIPFRADLIKYSSRPEEKKILPQDLFKLIQSSDIIYFFPESDGITGYKFARQLVEGGAEKLVLLVDMNNSEAYSPRNIISGYRKLQS